MSNVAKEIQSAATWLQAEAARVPFGSVGIVLVLHRGEVSKVERTSSITTRPENGTGHDASR